MPRTTSHTRTGLLLATVLLGSTFLAPSPTSAEEGTPAPPTRSAERGSWEVVEVAPGSFEVAWTSPSRLPIGSDRPTIVGPGLAFGPPTVAPDGRTVLAVVSAPVAPDPDDLEVLLSGDRLDEPGNDVASATSPDGLATPPIQPAEAAADVLDADPGVPGEFAVVTSDYQLAPVRIPRMPDPIEMVGHVVEPAADAATGPRPLVLFMHGRHGFCYKPGTNREDFEWPCTAPFVDTPSHLGYDYIQRVLASQGYATVSVRVNGINAQDHRLSDGGAGARATIVQRHLDYWTGLAAEHQVDLDQVVLVGHSRGGEGVDRASIRVPLSAPYRIVGQVLIAPTDFAAQTAPYVPTVTLLPYCDGDVSDLQGQKFTDVGRDLTSDDTSLKSSVMVMGANHNFFNTEWTPSISKAPSFDDWGGSNDKACGKATEGRLNAAEQRAVGRAYVAGAVHVFTGDEESLPLFDGSRVTVPSIGTAEVLSHAIGGGRVLRRPSVDTSLSLTQGAETRFCQGVADYEVSIGSCGSKVQVGTPHWTMAGEGVPTRRWFEMSWLRAGARGGMVLDQPLDLSAGRLEARTIVDSRRGDVRLGVRLTDTSGASADVTPEQDGELPELLSGRGVTKLWAQALLVDVSGVTGVDLTQIARVELIGESARGRVWVADLAAAPAALAPVPDRRTPLLDVSRVRVSEGDRDGVVIGRVPFKVTGDVSRPSSFTVVTFGPERGSKQRFTVDLAPGQTSGNIPVSYSNDELDDRFLNRKEVVTWATRGLMTDVYQGQLLVADDDPTPRVTVTPVAKTVAEGKPAVFEVRLGKPVDYDMFETVRVIRGPGRELSGNDVPADWLAEHAGGRDNPRGSLASLKASLFWQLRQGAESVLFEIPTVRDGVREGRESVTIRLKVNGRKFVRTIYVGRSR